MSVALRVNPELSGDTLDALFAAAWPDYAPFDWAPVLSRSLAYVGAFDDEALVGFVNLAWDGGVHAFLLDTSVHPAYRRRGIGQTLVERAIAEAMVRGVEWVHVDYEPHLDGFYRGCGFTPTAAGLVHCRAV